MESDSTEDGIRIGGRYTMAEIERAHVIARCEHYKWNVRQACRSLGLGFTTVYRWLDAWGIDVAAKRKATK